MRAREPDDPTLDDAEVVDALPVWTGEEPRVTPPATPVRSVSAAPARTVPVAQAAAVAATGFAAGAVSAVLVRQVGKRRAVKSAARKGPKALPVVGSRSFLVDVHLLGPRD